MKPLKGIRVIDLSRLAPGPYGTMLLADFGAEVIAVGGGRAGVAVSQLARGKTHITLDLKNPLGLQALYKLVETADVVVEGFRPGVCDRLKVGYEDLKLVKRDLVYCSVTGWGQTGPLSQTAGHDINYLAVTGALGTFGPAVGPPVAPLNLLADFGGGGLLAAFEIAVALRSRDMTGEPQYVDTAMIDGVMSMMTMHYPAWGTSIMPSRGLGFLGGEAPFYRCYECSDGRFVAVGAVEKEFFVELWRGLELPEPVPDHFDPSLWAVLTECLSATFANRSRDDWASHFGERDACVTAVFDPVEAWKVPQVEARMEHGAADPSRPRLVSPPKSDSRGDPPDMTAEVLLDVGVPQAQIELILSAPVTSSTGLKWPPE